MIALVSVGGSPSPVLFTLRRHQPSCVWYFCSTDSRPIADGIHARLDWHPDRDFIEVERFEELGPCYRALRQAIPDLLKKWKVQAAEVLVDYTGGTKTMSAALVLAATEIFDQFSYVGGEQRDKGGLGFTVDGKERVLYQNNPWSELAIREVERARDLWDGCLFDAAAKVLRETAAHVPRRLRFEGIANVGEAMAARHRLDFRDVPNRLGNASRQLPALFDGKDDAGLCAWVQAALPICAACAKDTASEAFLRELLDNALRTAAQGRFEDAAARLYRAMEMQGQIWLAEASANLFVNGKCKKENTARLSDPLQALVFCRPDEHGEIKLSFENLYRALAALGQERAKTIVADLGLEKRSRWRQATDKRNAGILAHGVQPVGKEGFEEMKIIAAEFLGLDLTKEANPIPDMDSRWLL